MDFIEGQTLSEHLSNSSGYLPVEEALQIAIQLCTVLDYLHTHQPQIIFRDLKPDNIILTRDGHVYLIDFGIARFFKPGQMKDTTAFGSQGYAAPEQYGKTQTTPRSDIYSLGVLLHQLLTGNNPATNTPTIFDFPVLKLPTQPTPVRLSTLITRMLEKDSTKRPQSVADVKRELQQIATELATGQMSVLQPHRQAAISPTLPVAPALPLPPTRILPGKTRIWAIAATSIAFIVIIAILIPILENHLAQSSSQLALNSTPTVAALAPTATPMPTSAPSPTPVPPTPTPAPKAGDTLYQADQSWSGWNGTKDWKVANGMLLNDGTYSSYNTQATISAPYQPGEIADYSVEARIEVVSALTTSTVYPCFGITVRGVSSAYDWQGYEAGVCVSPQGSAGINVRDPNTDTDTNLTSAPYNPGNTWHTYRVEAKGSTIKFLIDGGLMVTVNDNRFLSGGQIGMLCYNTQIDISSFKVVAL